MAPLDKRQHLMLNKQRLDTAEVISDDIEEYCEAAQKFNREAKEPLEFGALVVGADEKGKCDTTGKGQVHKRLGYQPPRGEQHKFGRYRNSWWSLDHQEAHC